MNRIQALSIASEIELQSGASPSEASAATYAAPGKGLATYFAPLHYEANYAYPLLVWLHGNSDDERQLKRVMPLVSLRNYVGTAPRGTLALEIPGAGSGYAWAQSRAHVALAEQRVFESIDLAMHRYNISPRRVFLAGFDAGGTMAFRLAMDHPDRFAGVLSLCGEFPITRRPFSRLTEARRIPIFLACGRDSQKYPTASVCENLKLFHSAGMNIALRQYPCGHQITPLMLSDMDRWIMEQITGSAVAAG